MFVSFLPIFYSSSNLFLWIIGHSLIPSHVYDNGKYAERRPVNDEGKRRTREMTKKNKK